MANFFNPFFCLHVKHHIQQLKVKGQDALKTCSYKTALYYYNEALISLESCGPYPPLDIQEEIPKILCNRSMVLYKLEQYDRSLEDAVAVINTHPVWFKGYWRAAQACKALYQAGNIQTLSYLLQGLGMLQDIPGSTKQDLVVFLVEVVSILPKAPRTATDILENTVVPSDPDIWTTVIQKLFRTNCWEGICLLMTGIHGGPSSQFDKAGVNCSCKAISVGSLLKDIAEFDLQNWGERLAVELLKCGASYDEIGVKCQKPPVHVGIQVSLETGSVAFLRMVLDNYSKCPEMLNSIDSAGNSGFHILMHSGKLHTTTGDSILRLLLNYNCNPYISDHLGKHPIEYVKQDEPAYILLDSSPFLRKRIDELKTLGNHAYNKDNYDGAYNHYSEAILLTKGKREYQKEAAILYSNRSAVLGALKKNQEALSDAVCSIKCDETYHKGRWRKGQILKSMGNLTEAYYVFLDGYFRSKISSAQADVKLNFLFEVASLLPSICSGGKFETFVVCYKQLKSVDKDAWPHVLARLGNCADWQSIGYLMLGPKLALDAKPCTSLKSFGSGSKQFEIVSSGVAKYCSTQDVPLNTVFRFLEGKVGMALQTWLEPLLVMVLLRGDSKTLESFAETHLDTPLHAAVRFSLMTGGTSILDALPVANFMHNANKHFTDGHGDSVFHTMTKLRPCPPRHILIEVAQLMIHKGLSACVVDKAGKLPVDYLSKGYDDDVFNVFLKALKELAANDVLFLKEEGNRRFTSGDTQGAIEFYNSAIVAFKRSGVSLPNNLFGKHDIAVLYSNKAECFLKQMKFNEALNDALQSVMYDQHWYKAHVRVGKSFKGLGQFEQSFDAFLNAFDSLEKDANDRLKVELLVEITVVFGQLPIYMYDVRSKIPNLPNGLEHLWVKTAYTLVCKNEWDLGTIAINQQNISETKLEKQRLHLAPLCNIVMVKHYPWCLDIIRYFLMCGSDRHTISATPGDTYLHAVVRLTLHCRTGEQLRLLNFVAEEYVAPWKEQNMKDNFGNTAMHTATSERNIDRNRRQQVVETLLNMNVDPSIINLKGFQALNLLPKNERQTVELLLMADCRYTDEHQKKANFQPEKNKTTNIPKTYSYSSLKGCDQCDVWYKEAVERLEAGDNSRGYDRLSRIVTANHTTARHRGLVVKCFDFIADRMSVSRAEDVPRSLTNLSEENYINIINELADRRKWRQLDSLVRTYRDHKGSNSFTNFAKVIDICDFLRDETMESSEDVKLKILENLLKSGAMIGRDGGREALALAVQDKHYRVVVELLKYGIDPADLTLKSGDTPVHAALVIGFEGMGNLSLFVNMLERFDEDPENHPNLNPEQIDNSGQCLFHIIAKAKYSGTVLRATEILCDRRMSANVYDKHGKLPQDYLTKKNDRRREFLKMAAAFPSTKPQQPMPTNKNEPSQTGQTDSTDSDAQQFQKSNESNTYTGMQVPRKITVVARQLSFKEARKMHIEQMISLLPDKPPPILHGDATLTMVNGKTEINLKEKASQICNFSELKLSDEDGKKLNSTGSKDVETGVSSAVLTLSEATGELKSLTKSKGKELQETRNEDREENILQKEETTSVNEEKCTEKAKAKEIIENIEEEETSHKEDDDQQPIDAQVFDNLAWEVECTAEVWKALRDRHIQSAIKRKIVRKVQLLASGDWQPHLCKKLKHAAPTLQLYEAKLSKGSRIIWELAKAFSPRYSQTANRRLAGEKHTVKGGRIYSEIIRVWDIVLQHDKIFESVKRINQSHKKGEMCIIQKQLKELKKDNSCTPSMVMGRFPRLFAERDKQDVQREQQQESQLKFFPPASPRENEYHILKFYSFSSSLVSYVLQNIEVKVDFPFRVTDIEHAIINLSSDAPILLLGRSGTGKTTCCLYRLWSQFSKYWSKAQEAGSPLLPRCQQLVPQPYDKSAEQVHCMGDVPGVGSCVASCGDAACVVDVVSGGQQYDHLHQLFITKNSVLCCEVQKNFHELSLASDVGSHVVEVQNLPSKLQDIDEHLFPLFLTSRQMLIMLDASVGPPFFFDRNIDGTLKVNIQGWIDANGPLGILPLLDDDSDREDGEENTASESGDEDEVDDYMPTKHDRHGKSDPRREVSYEIFVEEIWPRIKKDKKVSYHPSLIWTEIMSFIKGSFEALCKPSGILGKEEYIELGRKRAPNFSGERDKIYKFFKRYEQFKKQNSLFDETDLVQDVYKRLIRLNSPLRVIHQIFVDETQDFTQAELCLLIKLCQNPNEMFFTGDTAQSIMRGISFRFSDLRSLFYHAQMSMQAVGKTNAVVIPRQVYQLTHNYRSHAGILSLASSVLDIMVEFFPESFDRLKKDQGLFQGPRPVLLESCSFSDLAVLLRGNRRKTSHIEFGAHQAILVVNEAAKETIPEELRLGLVLTIYESKGLEFDDILLYNFFKDSQANKEWRVVIDYLERVCTTQKDQDQKNNSKFTEEILAEIDQDDLETMPKPRPLSFDPNEHKVLNSELKHLYTAVTRARVNVWIFDEDFDKRAPMFKYFKAKKLAKTVRVTESDETNLAETMFAEKSSADDWIRRGEDFMAHALYKVAAKCFGMGGEMNRQMVALAHQQALIASRIKNNPRQMSEEFMYAADLYLECGKPGKAAVCLQNAREGELAAQLYEKLGQYDRAAEQYTKLNRAMSSSRCYETIGHYNQAIEVLYNAEYYDSAIDCLRRYHMKVKHFSDSGAKVPAVFLLNQPKTQFSEDRLCYKSAELHNRYKNEERMLDSLLRLPRLEDRVNFLKEKGHLNHAARLLEESGQITEAANVMLMNERLDNAVSIAKRALNKRLIARCLLVRSRVAMVEPFAISKVSLIADLNEADNNFRAFEDHDGHGDTCLHLADITGNVEYMQEAYGAFCDSKPFSNEIGRLECVNWLFSHNACRTINECKMAVRGFEMLFEISRILLRPTCQDDDEKGQLYCSFYGMDRVDQNTFVVYPSMKPRCLEVIKNMSAQFKKNHLQLPRDEMVPKMVEFLLLRSKRWLQMLTTAIYNCRDLVIQCEHYIVGTVCPGKVCKNGEDSCMKLHQSHDTRTFKALLEADKTLGKLESAVHQGAKDLLTICPATMEDLIGYFLKKEVLVPYKSCELLLRDIMPVSHQPRFSDPNVSQEIMSVVRNYETKEHMRKYLTNEWQEATSGDTNLKSLAAKSTEVFNKLEVGNLIFSCFTDPKKIDDMIAEFQNEVTKEMIREYGKEGAKGEMERFTLMGMRTEDRKSKKSSLMVLCISKRFQDAIRHISGSFADPLESLIGFTKFVCLLSQRNQYSFLPELSNFLYWMEFFTLLSFQLIAKMRVDFFPDFLFVVPSSYLIGMRFIEATYSKAVNPIHLSVLQATNLKEYQPTFVQTRLQRMVNVLCGMSTKLNLIKKSFQFKGNARMEDVCLAERVLILGMVLVCNVGKTVQVSCEHRLMEVMSQICVPVVCSKRLATALLKVKNARGVFDVAAALQELLKERDDSLFVCKWSSKHLKAAPLQSFAVFSRTFLTDTTKQSGSEVEKGHSEEETSMQEGYDDINEEQTITKEDQRKWLAEQKAQQLDRKRRDAKICIVNWWRTQVFRFKCKTLKSRLEEYIVKRGVWALESVQIGTATCEICGVSFDEKMQIKLDNTVQCDTSSMSRNNKPSQTIYTKNENDSTFEYGTDHLLPFRYQDISDPLLDSPSASDKSENPSANAIWKQKQYAHCTDSSRSDPYLVKTHDPSSRVQLVEQQSHILTEENRRAKLEIIRNDHLQSKSHIEKQLALRTLTNYWSKHVISFEQVTTFINAHKLVDADKTATMYPDWDFDISRLRHNWRLVKLEMQSLLSTKNWDQSQKMQTAMMEMLNSYENVKQYVIEKDRSMEEDENRTRTTDLAFNVRNKPEKQEYDTLEEIAKVVDDPTDRQRFKPSSRIGRRYIRKPYMGPTNLPPRLQKQKKK